MASFTLGLKAASLSSSMLCFIDNTSSHIFSLDNNTMMHFLGIFFLLLWLLLKESLEQCEDYSSLSGLHLSVLGCLPSVLHEQ